MVYSNAIHTLRKYIHIINHGESLILKDNAAVKIKKKKKTNR